MAYLTGRAGVSLQHRLLTPELQWQSRGEWRILQGCKLQLAVQEKISTAVRTVPASILTPSIPCITPELQWQSRGNRALQGGVRAVPASLRVPRPSHTGCDPWLAGAAQATHN
jgi:hypothetical protein